VSGTRSDSGALFTGQVNFGSEGGLSAGFETPKVSEVELLGLHTEFNLFVISFWSFEGMVDSVRGKGVSGSGIRLFFGLLVLGSFELPDSTVFSFFGVVDSEPTAEGSGRSEELDSILVMTNHVA